MGNTVYNYLQKSLYKVPLVKGVCLTILYPTFILKTIHNNFFQKQIRVTTCNIVGMRY